MTSIFDGMGSILTGVFGTSVSYLPQSLEPRQVASIFREEQVEAEDQDGRPVLIMAPVWRVRRDLVPELARKDRIQIADGRVYEIDEIWPPTSPAADGLTRCVLRKVAA